VPYAPDPVKELISFVFPGNLRHLSPISSHATPSERNMLQHALRESNINGLQSAAYLA
jgi:hypothetical protein